MNSSNLRTFKTQFEDELNKRGISSFQLVLHKGNALISDKHPASNIIKVISILKIKIYFKIKTKLK